MKNKSLFLIKSICGIFLIKVLFFSTFYLASCNKEQTKIDLVTEEQKKACQEFVSTLKRESLTIKEFISRHKIELNEMRNSNKLLLQNQRTNISLEDSINFILLPSTKNATKVILAFGGTEQDIIDTLGGITDSRQITVAFALLKGSNVQIDPELVRNININEFFGTSAMAAPKWLECVGEALGLNFFQSISTLFEQGGQAGVRKLLGEVVKRYLGPAAVIGVVATYLWCMW